MNDTRLWVADLLAQFSGQENTLIIPRAYIDITGSIEDALLLSQIIYWSDRTKMDNGWFAKSYAEWQVEIALSKYQVTSATKRLKPVGVETIVKKFNGYPTVHYHLRKDVFELWIVKKLDERKSRNLTNDSKETSQSLTETTPETTTDIKDSAEAPSQSPAQSATPATSTVKGSPLNGNKKRSEKSPTTRAGWLARLPAVKSVVDKMLLVCYEGWDSVMHKAEESLTVTQLENYITNAEEYIRLGGKSEEVGQVYEYVADLVDYTIAPKTIAGYYLRWKASQKTDETEKVTRAYEAAKAGVETLMTDEQRKARAEQMKADKALLFGAAS